MTYKTTKAVRNTQDNGFYYHGSASKAELLALLEGGE